MARKREHGRFDPKTVRLIVIMISIGWLVGFAPAQFGSDGTSYTFRSKYYVGSAHDKVGEGVLADRICSGNTVAKRYDCRSSIRLANQQRIFAVWVTKFVIVLGPPLLLVSGYRLWMRRRDRLLLLERRRALKLGTSA